MDLGATRTLIARIFASIGFICGIIGLAAGMEDRIWKLSPWGWFTGGILLMLIALFVLLDGAIAFQKMRIVITPPRTEARSN
jgi:bacteriorhodopsin